MPGRSERFEIFVQTTLDELPQSVTHPLLIVADHIGITVPELILYGFALLGLAAAIFVPSHQSKKTRTPD